MLVLLCLPSNKTANTNKVFILFASFLSLFPLCVEKTHSLMIKEGLPSVEVLGEEQVGSACPQLELLCSRPDLAHPISTARNMS